MRLPHCNVCFAHQAIVLVSMDIYASMRSQYYTVEVTALHNIQHTALAPHDTAWHRMAHDIA